MFLGVCSSVGVIRDFAGSGTVQTNNLAFGHPTRYLVLMPEKSSAVAVSASSTAANWDEALTCAAQVYNRRPYHPFFDNCHDFVGYFLGLINYKGRKDWTMFRLVCLLTTSPA